MPRKTWTETVAELCECENGPDAHGVKILLRDERASDATETLAGAIVADKGDIHAVRIAYSRPGLLGSRGGKETHWMIAFYLDDSTALHQLAERLTQEA